jgi:hypothetical protein
MTLSEVIDYFKYGDLAQVFLGTGDDIEESNLKRLISNINVGTTELYKRFPLSIKEVIVQQYPEISRYSLTQEHSEANKANYLLEHPTTPDSWFYIMDSVYEPFTGDVLVIDSVFTEEGEELPLNDEYRTYSVFTPSYNTLIIPFSESENAVSVIYKANPPIIKYEENMDLEHTEVALPIHLLEPLSSFVAHRVFANTGSNPNESMMFLTKYTNSCNNIDLFGLVNKESVSNLKLEVNGWV